MKKINLVAALLAIAAANPGGFTVTCGDLAPVAHGYAVAVAETQNSFGPDGLERVIKYAATHPEINAFGGWLNSDNGAYYFDATIIVDSLERALEIAKANGQIAIFCLHTLEEIRVK